MSDSLSNNPKNSNNQSTEPSAPGETSARAAWRRPVVMVLDVKETAGGAGVGADIGETS